MNDNGFHLIITIKLIGSYGEKYNRESEYPEYFIRLNNAKKFIINHDNLYNNDFNFIKEIDCVPLNDCPLTGLTVLQFAAFMNPTDIYLVGYDNTFGHFTNKNYSSQETSKEDLALKQYISSIKEMEDKCWNKFKEFLNSNYKETRVHSINPVGLTKVFDDIYQDK